MKLFILSSDWLLQLGILDKIVGFEDSAHTGFQKWLKKHGRHAFKKDANFISLALEI